MSIKSPLNRQFGTQFDSVFDVVKSNPMYDKTGGKMPSLDLNFAKSKSLRDSRSTKNLINFTRASSGTYVDSDGLIKTSPVNLVRYSEQIDQWTGLSGATITISAALAPDGSMTADRLFLPASNATFALNNWIANDAGIHTGSIYVKAATPGTNNQFTIWLAGDTSETFTATDEWVRYTWTRTIDSDRRFGINNGNDTFASDVYIWGAQLEEGTTATDYIPTGATIGGAPRFDHDPVTGESLGLLIEEGRTNLLTYSEEFDNSGWGKIRVTVTTNSIIAPDGTLTADKIIEDVTSSQDHILAVQTPSSVATYTYSFFAKAGERSHIRVSRATGIETVFAHYYTLENNGTTTGGGNITAYPNGWYRCYGQTVVNNAGNSGFAIRLENSSTNNVYNGDGTSGIYLWGAQYEQGSFPTSYIPTSGSTVTRSPDIATIEGNKFAKTNLLSYSERFDQSAWSKATTSIIPDNSVAPDGSQTAELVLDNTVLNSHQVFQTTPTLKISTDYTFSVYVKAASLNYCFLLFYSGGGAISNSIASFDLVNNTSSNAVGSPVTSIKDVGDGWRRIAITATTSSAATTLAEVRLSQDGVWGNRVYSGSGQGIYIWGAQLEEGSELTEYTPSVDTFVSRASSATYVDDATGLIKTTPVNLVRYSEQFNSWLKSNSTITANTVMSPAGTLTADTLTINSGSTYGRIQMSNLGLVSSVYTLSYYVKNTVNIGNNVIQVLDSSNTAITITLTNFSGTTTSDWTRYEHTFDIDSSALTDLNLLRIDFRPSPSPSTGSSTIDIWGAQLEEGTTASPYIKTGSTISGAARYENGELLLEPARTNLLAYSEEFENAAWSKASGASIDSTLVNGPDSNLSGRRLLEFDFQLGERLTETVSITNSTLTGSIWLKGEGSNIGKDATLTVKRSGGTYIATNVVHTLTADWVRVDGTLTQLPDNTGVSITIVCPSTNPASEVLVFGAQLEAAPYASSYIPTTSSTVTRAADVSTSALGVDSWYNQSEGAMFAESKNYPHPVTGKALVPFQFTDNSYNNLIQLGGSTGSTQFNFTMISGGSNQSAILGNFVSSGLKASGGYKSTGSAGSLDGAAAVTSNTPNIPSVISQLDIGRAHDGNNVLNGHITRLAYYPTRLPDDKLRFITTRSNPFRQAIAYGITSAGGTFNLRSTGTVNYNVDWDSTGGYESSTSNALSHTYTAGNYNIQVYSNDDYTPYFNNVTADVSQITSVVIGPGADLGTSLDRAWYGATNMTSFVCPFDVTSGVTSFNSTWRSTSLTSFPLIDTSAGTNFFAIFMDCTGLTSLPLIDTSNGIICDNFCKSTTITTFPSFDFSSATRFLDAWYGCTNLTDFPANMFDTTGTLIPSAFRQAWQYAALSAQSIENILVSLDTNGASGINLSLLGGTNAAKTTWSTAAVTAYDNLIVKGWTIFFNA